MRVGCAELWAFVVLAVIALAMPIGRARAADCAGPYSVATIQRTLADGREVAVWYPMATAASRGLQRRMARDGAAVPPAIAACAARWPVVLFSHGVAGCNEQAVYITEDMARHGYIVAAPNHRDAICGVVLARKFPDRPDSKRPSFLEPQRWTVDAWRDRARDLRQTLDLLESDPFFAAHIDADRIGLMGHSLGGYTALGAAGGWPGWEIPGVRAVIAFAPFAQPLVANHRLQKLRVPVMYQVATWDFGITASVVDEGGAFAGSPAPKYLVELGDAGHLLWTNYPCRAQRTTQACLAAVANAGLVDAYALAFFDRYLKDLPSPLLDGKGAGLRVYRKKLR